MKQWASSGLSKMAYCRKHQISYPTFMNWFSRNKAEGKFVDLTLPQEFGNVITFTNGIKLNYSGAITSELISLLKDA